MKRKRRKSRLIMDFMELMRDTTRFLREAQYLSERDHTALVSCVCVCTRATASCFAHLVILKILRSRSALRTLIPKDMPGLKKPQTTSKMLPTITCRPRNTESWLQVTDTLVNLFQRAISNTF